MENLSALSKYPLKVYKVKIQKLKELMNDMKGSLKVIAERKYKVTLKLGNQSYEFQCLTDGMNRIVIRAHSTKVHTHNLVSLRQAMHNSFLVIIE